jgi:phosphatidylinositol N-acetylglucosaminyltransferase subunit A
MVEKKGDANQVTLRKRKRHRIAMVCDFFYPNLGGVENHIWSLSQHLIQHGHKVIIITHGYGNRKGVRYLPGPLKVYYCPIVPMTANDALPTFTATLPLLRWILIREGIEIVHAHQATSTMANESVVYAATMGLASVYTDHSLFGFDDLASVILNRVLQTTLSTVDAAICVSHTCRDNFILRTRMSVKGERAIPLSSRVRVIPNAVSPSMFTPAKDVPVQRSNDRCVFIARFCERVNANSHSILLVTTVRIKVVVVSRLVYRKGVDLLVGIIPNVCQKLENVDFIIGGDGAKLLLLQEMVERERLQERVEFLGSVPHAQVRDVLVRGHVFLNCSLTESFCIAILEAASCGLLVVSTNVGGVPEVLPDDMILLAEPKLPAMVDSVVRAIERQSSQPVNPLATHERVKSMYSWQRVALETEQVYDGVLGQQRRSFIERMSCYKSLGVISGYVACFLACLVELWYQFVEWWQPRDKIDRAPDLFVGRDWPTTKEL